MPPLDKVLNLLLGNGPVTGRVRISICARLLIYFGFTLLAGCTSAPPNHFTFTADLPPGFAYKAIAVYVPDEGETCTVPGGRKTEVGYNLKWRKEYEPNSVIALYRTVSGCPLVLSQLAVEVASTYGKALSDYGSDFAYVTVHYARDKSSQGKYNHNGEADFYGQCQWYFRTMGKHRVLRKILDCTSADEERRLGRGKPFAAYAIEQLPGKTVRLNIKLAEEESPYYKGWWLKSPDGWRPCTGRWGTVNEEPCIDPPKFTDFMMFDGRRCTVYPSCTE
ncbi:hypothetical protein [Pseudomonas defluvii]|uniref:hypothetical protein n=1 Tax=Pseudomonas defluvii TaxID=1876757 RepID=UPI00390581FA